MFLEGDLVTPKNYPSDTDKPIYRVLETEGDSVHYASGNDDGDDWMDKDDLVLVKSVNAIEPQEVNIPTPNVPTRSIQDIYDNIEKLFVQMVQYYEALGIDKRLDMSITTVYYPGSKGIDVQYSASVGYDSTVRTRALVKSVQLVCDRYRENNALKPRQIPLFKE